MNLEELKERLRELGWILVDYKRFKKHDRIVCSDGEVVVRIDLRHHLEQISWRALEWFFNPKKECPQKTIKEYMAI